jgi:hypothetical protein
MLHIALMMEAESKCEMSTRFCQITRRNIPENGHLYIVSQFSPAPAG